MKITKEQKEQLYYLYHNKKMTLDKISKEFNVSRSAIGRCMDSLKIKKRTTFQSQRIYRGTDKITKIKLENLYFKKKKTQKEIAQIFNCSPHTIWKYFKRFKIKTGHSNFIDITGQKFGFLVAQKYVGKSKWLCICDCGNTTTVNANKLKTGNTVSCKCYRNTILTREKSLGYGYASFREVLRSYIRGAKTRGLEYKLSEEETKQIMESNCFYCGLEPKQIYKHKECFGEFIYNGIDRVDSNLGYTKKNTVTCCKACNYAKRDFTLKDFRKWVDRISKHKNKVKW